MHLNGCNNSFLNGKSVMLTDDLNSLPPGTLSLKMGPSCLNISCANLRKAPLYFRNNWKCPSRGKLPGGLGIASKGFASVLFIVVPLVNGAEWLVIMALLRSRQILLMLRLLNMLYRIWISKETIEAPFILYAALHNYRLITNMYF